MNQTESVLNDLINTAKSGASQLVEEGQEVRPAVFIAGSSGKVNIVGMIMPDDMAKDMFQKALLVLLRKFNAVGYVFVSEAWLTRTSNEELVKDLDAGKVHVRDLPLDDRTEAVVITVVENSKSIKMITATTKMKDGQRYIDSRNEEGRPETLTGRMVVKQW